MNKYVILAINSFDYILSKTGNMLIRYQNKAVVAIVDRVRHRRYNKTVQRTKKLFVHDSENDLNVGDRVRIQETRPLSKKKRWRIVEILERAR